MREIGRSPLLFCSKGSLTAGFTMSQPAAMAKLVPRAALHVPRKKSPTQDIGLPATSAEPEWGEHLINEFSVRHTTSCAPVPGDKMYRYWADSLSPLAFRSEKLVFDTVEVLFLPLKQEKQLSLHRFSSFILLFLLPSTKQSDRHLQEGAMQTWNT